VIPLPSHRWLAVAAAFSLVGLLGLVWPNALSGLLLLDALWIVALALDATAGVLEARTAAVGAAAVLLVAAAIPARVTVRQRG